MPELREERMTSGLAPQNGFTMPAEWEPHVATWLAWPHNRTDWPGKFEPIPYVYAEIVRNIVPGETVHMVVNDDKHEQSARKVLKRAHVPLDRIEFHQWRTNRGWTRDSGPIFVRHESGPQYILNWGFNAWAKYPDWELDDQFPAHVSEHIGVPQVTPTVVRDGADPHRFVLEGGSIDVNGRGTLLTTRECLLSQVQQRNPGLSQEQIEQCFARYLGIRKVIWLDRGIAGDDTHGHVDDIARFVGPETVVTVAEHNRDDANYEPLQENQQTLREATDQDGRLLRIVELPMPAPVWHRKRRLPASYANFYIANAAVLVPTFNDPNDRIALNTLAELFPDRNVIGIYCGDLVWGLGTLHCMTQQQPK